MAKVAKAYGVTVELVQENGVIVRVIPMGVDPFPVHSYSDEIPPPPPIHPDLDLRELTILEALEKVGVDVPMPVAAIRLAGPHNVGKLIQRGYVRYTTPEGTPHKSAEIALTMKAVSDRKANREYHKKYLVL